MVDYNVLAQSLQGGGNAFNAFLQGGQQRMQQQAFAAEQEEIARRRAEQQSRNQLLGALLDPQTAELVSIHTPVGEIQAPRAQVQGERFNQLAQLDPNAAIQFQQMQAQRAEQKRAQQQAEAKQTALSMQWLLKSKSPATLARYGFGSQLEKMGVDPDTLTDDQVREFAQATLAQVAPIAGMAPETATADNPFAQINPKDFTDSSVRAFQATGDYAALVPREGTEDPTDKGFTRANVLRDEYTAQTKDFGTVRASYDTIQAVASEPSAAGDISLITAYMRMLDPQSTVREGEFNTAQYAASVPNQLRGAYNKLLSGERLAPEQRADFVKQAKNMLASREKQAKESRKKYSTLAKKFKVDPSLVVGEDETAEAPGAVDLSTLSDDDLLKALSGG